MKVAVDPFGYAAMTNTGDDASLSDHHDPERSQPGDAQPGEVFAELRIPLVLRQQVVACAL